MFNYIDYPKICELFKEDINQIISEKIKDEDKDTIALLKECCNTSEFINSISKIIDFDFNTFIDKKVEIDLHINLVISKILIQDSTITFMKYTRMYPERPKKAVDFCINLNRDIRNFKNLNSTEQEEIIKIFKREIEIYNKIGISPIAMLDMDLDNPRTSSALEMYNIATKFISEYILKET